MTDDSSLTQAKLQALREKHGLAPIPEEPVSPKKEDVPEVHDETLEEEPVDIRALLDDHAQLTEDYHILKRVGNLLGNLLSLMRQPSIPSVDKRHYYDEISALMPMMYDVVEGHRAALDDLEAVLADQE